MEQKHEVTQPERPCGGNEGIACEKGNCQKCGWNPAVAKARTEKFMNQFKEKSK